MVLLFPWTIGLRYCPQLDKNNNKISSFYSGVYSSLSVHILDLGVGGILMAFFCIFVFFSVLNFYECYSIPVSIGVAFFETCMLYAAYDWVRRLLSRSGNDCAGTCIDSNINTNSPREYYDKDSDDDLFEALGWIYLSKWFNGEDDFDDEW